MSLTHKERTQLLGALEWDAKRFGPELASTAYERGLAVTDKENGSTQPIPITATPVLIDEAELRRRQDLAARLSSATLKMSRAVLKNPNLSDLVLSGLSPLEKSLALTTFESLNTLITTRVDFFVTEQLSALEVNATIPAMQGYSDIAANTFLEVVGRTWGAPAHVIASWQARNGSNALALYRALLSGYARVRPGQHPSRLALLCRRNDAQLTEQTYLLERFREWGAEADIVYPDQLSCEDRVMAQGKSYDLIYRHLFVRRLEEGLAGADYVQGLLAEPNGTRAVVLNPPASQVEVKAVFALLSQALEEGELALQAHLSEEELEAIEACVPWTRPFRGEALVAEASAQPDRFVLKRSWDYGGRAVFVGRTRGEPGFAQRVQTAYGEPLGWNELCGRAATDTVGGGFVIQQVIDIRPEVHILCTGPTQIPTELFVDFSAYASVGLETQPKWGGVCRGSVSHIVNIVGGGGVLPLITTEVAKSLLSAYRAWGK